MKLKNKLDNEMDKAWESLHQRLEEDGLLLSETDSGQPKLRHTRTWMWAASVAVLVTALVSFFVLKQENTIETGRLILANNQDQPTLIATLEDGSTVYLAGETSIEYPSHFAEDKRLVLLEGNAFFEISKDENCPFVIDTKEVLVEVLGTSFSVETAGEASFALSVRNGKVRITSKSTGQKVYVTAGQTAFLHSGKLETVAATNPMRFDAYLNRVYFKDQTLGNVLRIMNEKNNGALKITCSPELSERKFNVAFSGETPEEIAEIICVGLGLRYVRETDSVRILQSD